MKYRKKPVEVEAVRFDGTKERVEMEFPGLVTNLHQFRNGNYSIYLKNGHECLASKGDWIIKDPWGMVSVCRGNDFEDTYEPVEDSVYMGEYHKFSLEELDKFKQSLIDFSENHPEEHADLLSNFPKICTERSAFGELCIRADGHGGFHISEIDNSSVYYEWYSPKPLSEEGEKLKKSLGAKLRKKYDTDEAQANIEADTLKAEMPGWGGKRNVVDDVAWAVGEVAKDTTDAETLDMIMIGERVYRADDPEDMKDLKSILGPEGNKGLCLNKSPKNYLCDLSENHDGRHEAGMKHGVETWEKNSD